MSDYTGRIGAVLGGDALRRLRGRLRFRVERGVPLSGRLTLTAPSKEERSAVERLFGRLFRGRALHVDLDELSTLMQAAGLCSDLADAIVRLEGPIENRRVREAEMAERWRTLLSEGRQSLDGTQWVAWLTDVDQTGLLRRLAGRDPEEGAVLLRDAVAVLRRLPATALPLAELAAAAAGDSHALDRGEPLATLVLRAVVLNTGLAPPSDTDERRSAWAAVGVLCDELSSPALVLNLPARPDTATGRALVLAAETGEPFRLSTRQLMRDPPAFVLPPDSRVFVCENPNIVAAAANRLGPRSASLICIEGQAKTAARLLLGRLREAGAMLAYHGDFDWPGIQIANGIVARFGASPWRYGELDYLAAPPGAPLRGPPVTPTWDVALGPAMRTRGRAVHEEAIPEDLIGDLQ